MVVQPTSQSPHPTRSTTPHATRHPNPHHQNPHPNPYPNPYPTPTTPNATTTNATTNAADKSDPSEPDPSESSRQSAPLMSMKATQTFSFDALTFFTPDLSDQLYERYEALGGKVGEKAFEIIAKSYFVHTLASHIGGIVVERDGAYDETGFPLYRSAYDANNAVLKQTGISPAHLGIVAFAFDDVLWWDFGGCKEVSDPTPTHEIIVHLLGD